MYHIVYLFIIIVGGDGLTSQVIPQANMKQCQANAAIFNYNGNSKIVVNSYGSSAKTQRAFCLNGVK